LGDRNIAVAAGGWSCRSARGGGRALPRGFHPRHDHERERLASLAIPENKILMPGRLWSRGAMTA
jgi:hypothetical protein